MAFWGIEVKPGRPVTHKYDLLRGRLHVSQASLGLGSATNKSVVQCNIGDKSPVILCVLLPDRTESCHLDLEFQEADDVIFSVIGPRSVHLTGYYSGRQHSIVNNDSSESYGVDIANSDAEESVHGSEEDSYEDSFIDDADPEVFSPSPISSDYSSGEMLDKKPKTRNASRKRLRKRYNTIESEDESDFQQDHKGVSVIERDDEDSVPISTLLKSKTQAEEKVGKDMSKTGDKKIKDGVDHDKKTNDKSNAIENLDISHTKSKKKRKEQTSENPETDGDIHNNVTTDEKIKRLKSVEERLEKGLSNTGDKKMEDGLDHDKKTNDKSSAIENLDVSHSKSKKKRKERTSEKLDTNGDIDENVMNDEKIKQQKLEEENLENGLSKTGDKKMEDGVDHNKKTNDKSSAIENLDVSRNKSKKKKKERTIENSETDADIHDNVMEDEKIMQQKAEEEKLENGLSKTGGMKMENGVDHDKKTNDNSSAIENLAVSHTKSKKKRKERTIENSETDADIHDGVMDDEKIMQQKAEEENLTTDRKGVKTCDGTKPWTKDDPGNDERPKKRKKSNENGKILEGKVDNLFKEDITKQNEGVARKICMDIFMKSGGDHKLPHDKTDIASNPVVDEKELNNKKRKMKKKSKAKEEEENEDTGVGLLSTGGRNKTKIETNDINVKSKMSEARTLSHGLIIEDLVMGKPDGKIASSGKKIKVHYAGKLRDDGHTFDSNIGKSPLKLRLGAEGVSEGWNIGLDGMRVGGKRRLTIPPKFRDGSRGAGDNKPPDSWVVYEFDLVGVR